MGRGVGRRGMQARASSWRVSGCWPRDAPRGAHSSRCSAGRAPGASSAQGETFALSCISEMTVGVSCTSGGHHVTAHVCQGSSCRGLKLLQQGTAAASQRNWKKSRQGSLSSGLPASGLQSPPSLCVQGAGWRLRAPRGLRKASPVAVEAPGRGGPGRGGPAQSLCHPALAGGTGSPVSRPRPFPATITRFDSSPAWPAIPCPCTPLASHRPRGEGGRQHSRMPGRLFLAPGPQGVPVSDVDPPAGTDCPSRRGAGRGLPPARLTVCASFRGGNTRQSCGKTGSRAPSRSASAWTMPAAAGPRNMWRRTRKPCVLSSYYLVFHRSDCQIM